MRFLPLIKRSISVSDLIKICFAVSVVTGLLSAIVSDSRIPGIQQIMLGILPFFILSATVIIVFWLWAGKEKSGEALVSAFFLVMVGAAIGITVSFLKIWNDGSSYPTLSPREAWLSILTFGSYPTRFGPLVQIRFLPVVIFIGLGILLSRSGMTKTKAWLCSVIAYLVLGFSYHFMSWIAWLQSLGGGQSVLSTADTFRTLVRIHAAGYWSQAQLDRFFLPLGQQAENTLLMIHASVIFLITVILLVIIFIKTNRVPRKLIKRVAVKDSVLWVLPVIIGLSFSPASQSARTSYTDILALVVFAIVIALWIVWQRFGRDMDDLAQDELNQIDLPLPRGEITWRELEDIRNIILVVCLLGAWLLGWPVFLGILSATILAWLASRYGAGLGHRFFTWPAGSAVMGLSLAWAGAALTLRDVSSPAWIARILLGVAVLVGLSRLLKDLGETILISRFVVWIIMAGLLVTPLIVKQNFMWLPVSIASILIFWFSKNVQKWRCYGIYSIDLALILVAFIILFIPGFVRHL